MKKLVTNNEIEKNQEYLKLVTSKFFPNVSSRKKRNEIFQTAKFLMLYNQDLRISEIREGPDFIIEAGNVSIGLEHQQILHEESREIEGFFENICLKVEERFSQESSIPPFLANVHFHSNQKPKINQKSELIDFLYQYISKYMTTGYLPDNDVIDRIFAMHDKVFSIVANMGAWWQKRVDAEIISKAIEKKEEIIEKYISSTHLPQWLLLVIGGVGESSYSYEVDFELSISSKFEKIFLLEDGVYNLYEVK